MKIKIKNFYGELPDYLTEWKEYEVVNWYGATEKHPIILDDSFEQIAVVMLKSSHLNGGSWEIME